MGSQSGERLLWRFRARGLWASALLFGVKFRGTFWYFGSLIGHVLALTVWQSSHVISGSFALLARGRRLPHVVQKSRPL
jgi:hypothetical protein